MKKYDILNKFMDRKGYSNSNLCYYIKINKEEEIDYIIDICKKYIDNKVSDYNNSQKKINDLYENLVSKISMIGDNIFTSITSKGLVFKRKRNFALVIKRV